MYNTLYFHIRIQLCRFDYSHRPMQFLSMAQIEEFPHDRNVSMQSNCMSSYNITLFTIIFVSLWLSTLWNETFFSYTKCWKSTKFDKSPEQRLNDSLSWLYGSVEACVSVSLYFKMIVMQLFFIYFLLKTRLDFLSRTQL